MLLVVSTHQTIDVTRIPWTTLDGVLVLRCVRNTGTFNVKQLLSQECSRYDLPLYVAFTVPPTDDPGLVSRELLVGHGKLYDPEVITYDDAVRLQG